MKKPEKPLRRATVAESCDLSHSVADAVRNCNLDDEYLDEQTSILETKGEEMKVSIAADRSKALTDEVEALDDQRDACVSALKLIARGYMKWKHNNHSVYAGRIYALLKKHGLNMDDENYEEESALLESLLTDLELPENKEAADGLHLTELVSYTRSIQTKFSETFRKSALVEANKQVLVAATTLKLEVQATISETINYLQAMSAAKRNGYDTLAIQVNNLVGGLNQKIRSRRSNK